LEARKLGSVKAEKPGKFGTQMNADTRGLNKQNYSIAFGEKELLKICDNL
jgi:hypothetical protein